MPTVLIFANPISGRGRGNKIAARLERRLIFEGYSVRVLMRRADEISGDQLAGDVVAAIVIGGDGTLRTVAERLLLEISIPPLLIVPMGTANLMGQHLAIRWDDAKLEDQIVNTLRTGKKIHLDTATANGRLLLLIAGVGLDAKVVHALEERRSGPISHLSYLGPILHAISTYRYPPLTVTVDGKTLFGPSPALVFVGNIPEYGTGFSMLPKASSTDRLLDVCVLPCRSRAELISHVLRAAAGEHLHGENVVYRRGRQIVIDSPEPIPVQVDGEAAGHTPLAINLLPTRLTFIVPS